MTALEWIDDLRGREFGYTARPDGPYGIAKGFHVHRRENTRRFWIAVYPDGTSCDGFTTLTAAQTSCEAWEVDDSLVTLVGAETIEIDAPRATSTEVVRALEPETTNVVPLPADEVLPFRSVFEAHLWDTGTPVTRSVRGQALKNIATLAKMRGTVEQLVREQVAIARTGDGNQWGGYRWGDEPHTWSEIGQALGVSKQAAATRYGDKNS